MTKDEKDHGASLLPGDALASPPTTEALPNHSELVGIAGKWLKRQGCNVVLLERFAGNDNRGECPDAIGWYCSDFSSVVVECKVSREDFLVDAQKPCRNGPAMGATRWFLVPKGLVLPKAWPTMWGLLEWDGRVVRRVLEPLPFVDRSVENEARLLLAELRIFHARGITYPKLGSGSQDTSAERAPTTRRSAAQKACHESDTLHTSAKTP